MELNDRNQGYNENLRPLSFEEVNQSPLSKMLKNYENDDIFEFRGLQVSTPKRDMFGPPPLCTPSFGHMRNPNI